MVESDIRVLVREIALFIGRDILEDQEISAALTPFFIERFYLFRGFLLDLRPVIGVYGSLKVGKSTLLNQILEEEKLLKEGELEATGTVTTVRASSDPKSTQDIAIVHFSRFVVFRFLNPSARGREAVVLYPEISAFKAFLARLTENDKAMERRLHIREIRDAGTADWNGTPRAFLERLRKEERDLEECNNARGRPGKIYSFPRARWEVQLTLPWRPPLTLHLPKELATLHGFSAKTEEHLSRMVRAIDIQLSTVKGRKFLKSLSLVDLPGRQSTHGHHNDLAEGFEGRVLDGVWYLRPAIDEDCATTEFLEAIRRNEDSARPRQFVVTKVDESLSAAVWDGDIVIRADHSEEALLHSWYHAIIERWHRRHEVSSRLFLPFAHFVSAYVDRREAFQIDAPEGKREILNPVYGGIKRLLLRTIAAVPRARHDLQRRRLALAGGLLDDFDVDVRGVIGGLRRSSKQWEADEEQLKRFRNDGDAVFAKQKTAMDNTRRKKEQEKRKIGSLQQDSLEKYQSKGNAFLEECHYELQKALTSMKKRYQDLVATLGNENFEKTILLVNTSLQAERVNMGPVQKKLSGWFMRKISSFLRMFSSGADFAGENLREARGILVEQIEEAVSSLERAYEERVDQLRHAHSQVVDEVGVADRARRDGDYSPDQRAAMMTRASRYLEKIEALRARLTEMLVLLDKEDRAFGSDLRKFACAREVSIIVRAAIEGEEQRRDDVKIRLRRTSKLGLYSITAKEVIREVCGRQLRGRVHIVRAAVSGGGITLFAGRNAGSFIFELSPMESRDRDLQIVLIPGHSIIVDPRAAYLASLPENDMRLLLKDHSWLMTRQSEKERGAPNGREPGTARLPIRGAY
jgi:hypothetical protein